MHARWQAEAGANVKELPAFLKWLVASGYVTEHQANLLGQGHADDFFLNQYKILERIGRGRMAGVYKAVHSLGQVVAIKVLPPSRAKSPQILARFEREARLSLRLKHPNVVRSFQVGEANGVHYLVMEHLEGETLDELLRRRKTLPPEEAVRIAHQTLLGLQHLHEQGMVHRDLKPSNLFLARPEGGEPVVKILDIGLARELFEEAPPATGPAKGPNELTAEGVLLGTPDYLAPEQARDPRKSDIRADIYSAGCVLYHMLSGQTPFPDRNLLSQIVRHATEAPRPLHEFNPAIPEGLEQIVGWMLAKDPEKRYPTPARAAQALEVYLLLGARPAPVEEAPQMRRYLTWLETGDKTTVPPDDARPQAKPPTDRPGLSSPSSSHEAETVSLPPPAPAPPAPRSAVIKKAKPVAPAPGPAPQVDVELVLLPAGPAPARPVVAAPVAPMAAPVTAEPAPVIAARPKPARSGSRGLVIGLVAAVLVLSCGCAGMATLVWYLFL